MPVIIFIKPLWRLLISLLRYVSLLTTISSIFIYCANAPDLSASVLAGIKIPNRILINPAISFDDLNNVPEHVRQTTHGFFDESHESDYERFCSVYPSAMLSLAPEMDYDGIAPIIEGIINDKGN